jgi:hypothetical protein
MCYVLSAHALQRLSERGITDAEIAQALAGREIPLASDRVCHYDPRSRITVWVALKEDGVGVVTTVFKLPQNGIKKLSAKGLSGI